LNEKPYESFRTFVGITPYVEVMPMLGREAAMKRGVRFGRPGKLNPEQQRQILRLLGKGKPVQEVAKTFGVHTATIYRLLQTQL